MLGQHLYVNEVGFHGRPDGGSPWGMPGQSPARSPWVSPGAPLSARASKFRGFMFGPGGLQGVRGGVAVVSSSVQRPGEHGEFDLPVFKGARVVTVSGQALAPSERELDDLALQLSGLGAAGESVPLRHHAAGGRVLTGSGRVIAQEFDQTVGGIATATYMLSLSMRDPRWYGAIRPYVTSSDALVTMQQAGNVAAVPRFEVAGTFPNGYALHAAGRVVQVAGSASAITDVVDFRTGMVTRNGTLAPTLLQQAQFWSVPGHGVPLSWRLDRVGGTGTATASVPDTFM